VNTLSYKTISANKATVTKEWVVIDATNAVLGRFSSEVASILRGKNKPGYTPHVDCGDNVIVINAEKIRMTGKKMSDRAIWTYSGYPGGQRILSPNQMMAIDPTRVVEHAIKGMLPKNRLGREIFGNLHIYAGPTHPHEAQMPKTIVLQK